MFSGLAGASIFAFREYKDKYEIVKIPWLFIESMIWIFTPIISVALTILM
jgi:hypothetical protein